MASQAYLDYLEICVAQIEGGETQWVLDELTDALAAIREGKGNVSSLTNSGVNGKSFSRAIDLTAIEKARACQRAIEITSEDGDQEIGSTYADFSSIQR